MASAHLAKKGLFIVGAKRTPFGAFGGKLKGFSATELAYLASKAALVHAKVDPKVRTYRIPPRLHACFCCGFLLPGLVPSLPNQSHGPLPPPPRVEV